MRVISQDGIIDVPYEMVVVYVECESVIAKVGDKRYVMGSYSTEKKAIKAMEMLREVYIGMPIVMQNVDISDDVKKEFERLKKCGVMVRVENQPSKVECVSNTIFQFPQDDEIEV